MEDSKLLAVDQLKDERREIYAKSCVYTQHDVFRGLWLGGDR